MNTAKARAAIDVNAPRTPRALEVIRQHLFLKLLPSRRVRVERRLSALLRLPRPGDLIIVPPRFISCVAGRPRCHSRATGLSPVVSASPSSPHKSSTLHYNQALHFRGISAGFFNRPLPRPVTGTGSPAPQPPIRWCGAGPGALLPTCPGSRRRRPALSLQACR